MKRTIAILLMLIMTSTYLIGCGATNAPPSGSSVSGSQASSEDDGYPSGTVTLVVAYSAGGGTDRSARIFQPYLEKALGCNVIIENLGGGGTEIASTSVAAKASDGYTILVTNQPDLNWTLAFQDPAGYDEDTFELLMVSLIDPRIIIANQDSKYSTFTDFIEDAKANPGKLAIAVGQNSGVHALALYLREQLSLDYAVVPYTGGGEAAAALIGNQVDLCIGDAFSRYNLRDSVKCIAVMGSEHNELWPEGEPLDQQLESFGVSVPTLNRYESYMVKSDFKKLYPARYEKLVEAFEEAAQDPEYQAQMAEQNMQDIAVWCRGNEVTEALSNQVDFLKNDIAPLLDLG